MATDLSAIFVVDLDAPAVAANSPFGSFKAPFDGTATLMVALSNGGILSMTVVNKAGDINTTGPLQDDNPVGNNCWQGIDIKIRKDVTYSFQSDTAGVATHYVIARPQ